MAKYTPHIQFVVAHYNEDLSWLDEVADIALIYEKGDVQKARYPTSTIPLPNIGREGHSFLHHIVNSYDNLAPITVFVQGRIDDHVSLTAAEIKAKAAHTQPGEVITFPWRELELFDCWDGIPWAEYPCWEKWSAMTCKDAPKTPGQYLSDLLGHDKVPESIGFQPAAVFAVHHSTIRQRPRAFWARLLQDFFLGEMAHVNPMTGHYMERFWLAILRPDEYICWDSKTDTALERRNKQGQLARGRWHRTPRGVSVDVVTLSPSSSSSKLHGSSEDDSGYESTTPPRDLDHEAEAEAETVKED